MRKYFVTYDYTLFIETKDGSPGSTIIEIEFEKLNDSSLRSILSDKIRNEFSNVIKKIPETYPSITLIKTITPL